MRTPLNIIVCGICLAGSMIFLGCDEGDNGPEDMAFDDVYQNNTVQGTQEVVAVFGKWHKNGARGYETWFWANLYLEQDGTNVWGYYRWENYNGVIVRGSVVGNNLFLSCTDTENISGTIDGNAFWCQNNMSTMSVAWGPENEHGRQVFHREGEGIPETYW